ncbi:U3 snoRNP protein [Cryptotrichosporon argae]
MDEPPQKRFRYASYNEKLGNISIDVGKRKGLSWEKDDYAAEAQTSTPFKSELARLSLQDLTLPYQSLAGTLAPLTSTLPITLHNLDKIVETFITFLSAVSGGEDNVNSGLDSALSLIAALYETTLSEALPHTPALAAAICRVGALRALEPKLVEAAFSALSAVLRTITPALLKADAELRDTWAAVKPYLSGKAYVRKCVSDAWAGVLRKARGDGLARLLDLLLDGEQRGMEAVWANSMKGTSHHLHSRAEPIFATILDRLGAQHQHTRLMRGVVTALVHHCSSSATVPLVQAVLARLDTPKPHLLDVLSTFLLVRKGKRFSQPLVKPIMVKMQALIPLATGEEDRRALTTCIIGALQAGHLAEWLSPGVSLIESLWNASSTSEAYAFVDTLITLSWPGTEQFLLSHVARTALSALSTEPLPTLVLLNSLAAGGFFAAGLANVQGGRWRQSLVAALVKLLEGKPADRRALGQALSLVPHLTGAEAQFAGPILALVDGLRPTPDDVATGVWNDVHVVGRLLECAYRLATRGADVSPLRPRIAEIAHAFPTHREMLAHVADFTSLWSLEYDAAPLLPNLLSADASLRESTLRILAETQASAVWTQCLAVERAEMTLKNVRERTTQIGRLSRLLAAADNDDVRAVPYLIAQLKVNYRPIYAETVAALAGLAQAHADELWALVWTELRKTLQSSQTHVPDLGVDLPAWAEADEDEDEDPNADEDQDKGVEEDEDAEFTCPSLGKSRRAIALSRADTSRGLDEPEIAAQLGQNRLDVINYEAQLVAVLAAVPALAEKHTRALSPVLLAVSGSPSDVAVPAGHLSTRARQSRTATFLELFAKFSNPKAAYKTDDIHALYLAILSKGDARLQGLALKCLLTFKSPNLVPYGDGLQNLLDDAKFRDELTHFDLALDSQFIEPAHRVELVPVAIRLLYGILTSRRGRGSARPKVQVILTALSGCSLAELATLLDLMLESITDAAAGRQQLGFLTLLQDVLRYLGPQTLEHWPRLLTTTVELVQHAQSKLGDVAEDVADEDESHPAPLRSIRSAGLKRLVQFVKQSPTVDFSLAPYLGQLQSVVLPRLDKLEVENTQAPSGTLDLIAALAAVEPEYARFANALEKTFACMVAVRVKPAVILRVFDVVESVLDKPDVVPLDALLTHIIGLVQSKPADDVLKRLLRILARLAAVITNGRQAQTLAGLLGPMIKDVPERAKVDILSTLEHLYAISPDFAEPSSAFYAQNYSLVCNLFQTLYHPASRRALVATFATFRAPLADVVADLNAFSARRIDEPDFDRRLTAFAQINDGAIVPASAREWLPIVRSAFFFLQEPEELSIRTSASATLQRYITATAADGPADFLLPSLRKVLRSRLELVRNECLLVLSHAVRTLDTEVFREMRPLLAEDDEANVFVNIGHIQVHRRARALRRLRDVLAESPVREATVATVFIPLLEHILAGSTDVTDHHLVNEAVTTIGALARLLGWNKYAALVMRLLRLGGNKTPQQKLYIRAISAIIDNFHHLDDEARDEEAEDDDVEAIVAEEAVDVDVPVPVAAETIVKSAILNRILPALNSFVSTKDEAEDAVRIPLALGVVKLAHAIASEQEITRVVTTAAQILRSKDQDTRDIARDTVGKIAVFLGPEWLVRVLAELRTALQRGPQKHVLAVTVHSILVLAAEGAAFADLDEAIEDAVAIEAEVVWGESGRDVVTEGFKTKMREVRGAASRALDTFQLVARLVSPRKLQAILAPVREIMHASQAVRTMAQVDEVLRRIALGLNANARLAPADVLALCHALISGNSRYLATKKAKTVVTQKADRFMVQLKREAGKDVDVYALNAHRFVAFGLELFVTAFRRGRFDFADVDTLARLGPLVPAIGNTLYGSTPAVVLGLKATAAIARCPVPQVAEAMPVIVTNVFRIIKHSGSTESEVAQTALKTLAVLVRDCGAAVSDAQLKYLVELIGPDLDDHERQAAAFAVLRAVVSRTFVVPDVYDLMDRVSALMVTSQSAHVQELARGALVQFLLEYPQGAGRIKAQMTFLARNLDYVFEAGRLSVMELLAAVFAKFSDNVVADYADLFFVALTAVLENDDSAKCRAQAGTLLRTLFGRLDDAHQARTLDVLDTWVEQRAANPALAGAALNVYALLDTPRRPVVAAVLADSAAALAAAEAEAAETGPALAPALPLHALRLVAAAPTDAAAPWDAVVAHLVFPHQWVRFAAAQALNALLATPDAFDTLGDAQLRDISRKACALFDAGIDAKLADALVKLLWHLAKYWATQGQISDAADVDADAAADDTVDADDDVASSGPEANDDVDTDADATTAAAAGAQPNPLSWLMSRLSFLARRLIITRSSSAFLSAADDWTTPTLAILRFFAGVVERNAAVARTYLVHCLSPVYRILDGGDLVGVEGEGVDNLRQTALELRELVQAKVGASAFSRAWDGLRRRVGARRDERRAQRVRMAATEPAKWAERKAKRGVAQKDRRKRRTHEFVENRKGKKRQA